MTYRNGGCFPRLFTACHQDHVDVVQVLVQAGGAELPLKTLQDGHERSYRSCCRWRGCSRLLLLADTEGLANPSVVCSEGHAGMVLELPVVTAGSHAPRDAKSATCLMAAGGSDRRSRRRWCWR